MHGRDASGVLASLNSVAKIPYVRCLDGVSNTFSLVPSVSACDATIGCNPPACAVAGVLLLVTVLLIPAHVNSI
jgi:hypothetical protein